MARDRHYDGDEVRRGRRKKRQRRKLILLIVLVLLVLGRKFLNKRTKFIYLE